MTGFAVTPNISRTLAERLVEGRIPLSEALRYAMILAEDLRRIHDSGRAHGAVAPANVALTGTGLELLPALAPVGLASPYAAPEVLAGKAPDARSDIFSFGAVLYEMLTGRRPFEGESPAVPGSAAPSCGNPAADRFLSQCLAQEPAQRLQRIQRALLELKLLSVAVRRAEARPREPEATAIRAEIRELEARLAARLQQQENSASLMERAAGDALNTLRGELSAVGAQLAAAQEQAARAGQANSDAAERVIARVDQAIEAVSQRIGRVEQTLETLGQRAALAEQGLETLRHQTGAFQDSVAEDFQTFEQTLKEHAATIDSARTAMAQTDDLVERVVEALELLQSTVLDQAGNRLAAVN